MMDAKTTRCMLVLILALLVSCRGTTGTEPEPEPEEPDTTEEPAAATGELEVRISTTGETLDENGYTLTLDGTGSENLKADTTITFNELEEGVYALELGGVAANCAVKGDNPQEVTITAGGTITASMEVACEFALKDKIIFVSDQSGSFDVYFMNTDGSDVTRFTDTPEQDRYPAISPDGTRVVYWEQDPEALGSYGTLNVVNADGTDPVQLTDINVSGFYPRWSPDGERITFSSNGNIYIINADGSDLRKVTSSFDYDYSPSWSPDGEAIVFASNRDSEDRDIYVMNTDGSGLKNLTKDSLYNAYPVWSPDGTRLAFLSNASDPDGMYVPFDLYLMDADGKNRRKIADLSVSGFKSGDEPASPSWSPDGSKIVFNDGYGEGHAIYVVNSDGSGSQSVLISGTGVNNLYPHWSPLK